MIKQLSKITKKQLDIIMTIWASATKETHHFISETYWKSKESNTRIGIEEAEIFVYEIKGFLGLQGNHIAGVFIEKNNQSKGIGARLLISLLESVNGHK